MHLLDRITPETFRPADWLHRVPAVWADGGWTPACGGSGL